VWPSKKRKLAKASCGIREVSRVGRVRRTILLAALDAIHRGREGWSRPNLQPKVISSSAALLAAGGKYC